MTIFRFEHLVLLFIVFPCLCLAAWRAKTLWIGARAGSLPWHWNWSPPANKIDEPFSYWAAFIFYLLELCFVSFLGVMGLLQVIGTVL